MSALVKGLLYYYKTYQLAEGYTKDLQHDLNMIRLYGQDFIPYPPPNDFYPTRNYQYGDRQLLV